MKAMILAAGRGERLRPLTDTTPKPLLSAGGKPLMVWTVERLAAAGIRDIVVNHAHLGGLIEAALGDGSDFGARVRYSPEPEGALETAGGIAQALSLLGPEPFLVVNGDVFTDMDFSVVARRLTGHDLAHLVLVGNPDHHPTGDFGLVDGRVRDQVPRLTFSGVGVYRPELFSEIQRGSRAALAPLLRSAMAEDRISGERFSGRWVDAGTLERLASLDRWLREVA